MKTTIKSLKTRYLTIPLLFMLIGMVFSACSKSSDNTYGSMTPSGSGNPPPASGNTVNIQNNAFSPASMTVAVNTTVTWTNKDAIAHTVTSDAPLFDSGTLASNGTFSFKFTTAGSYSYHCAIHPSMTAVIIVQ